jgi:preprotein translocase subunit YajC
MNFFNALTKPFASFLSSDPDTAMMQAGLLALVIVILFLLFYTLRDIVLRTRSFVYQCFCILLVAFLPGVGFLLYLLIRPARTIKQREVEAMLQALVEGFFGNDTGIEDEVNSVDTETVEISIDDDEEPSKDIAKSPELS